MFQFIFIFHLLIYEYYDIIINIYLLSDQNVFDYIHCYSLTDFFDIFFKFEIMHDFINYCII